MDHLALKVYLSLFIHDVFIELSVTNSLTIDAVSSAIDGAKVDETCQRRSNQEISSSELEQNHCTRLRPTLLVLPLPAILVGYDSYLKIF